ncbi:NUDIX hydrolase [Thalassorhabdomicrobium marinisediminis]|uniref:DNA mismatch repair protein MutT n=1 Tax=Thalassorhabdomicrobium marinisediminis TaxID=2170577 RepID=A0A2T7FXE2_9RHOB|nr:NUDIX domain-containing protein [Thalassorhabdomicrobium marinisediminis]PVA06840.1 DNA mismatch repair protein MutT [Thalassorhabdomicrobium marinisediminis]
MEQAPDKTAVRPAATVILLRNRATDPAVLMGQRGARASFMPNKYVFPGGAVDPGDAAIDLSLADPTLTQLADASAEPPHALAAAAIRELWEETGQILGRPAPWPDAPRGWRGFAATGHRPDGTALEFIFRAITPRGHSRRFDARFFLAEADRLASDPDNFTHAEDELKHLHWVSLSRVRALDLPFITKVVLAEVEAYLTRGPAATVPFFRNDDEAHLVSRLAGRSPLD